ncbi:hypothetical protein CCR75_006865 [Bremia lactucae]|uniref:SPRY domain-containing protein n=1 Tax=Bremia lactucae TaxID=4779 RepID=A0A976FEH1_BRELC|nr:hypothetical protein CCR75_006865 [Bremia lactucae]
MVILEFAMKQSREPSLKRVACRLAALDDVLLHQILSYASVGDVESLTVAVPIVSQTLLSSFPGLWRNLFVQRWTILNFPLDADATLVIDAKLRGLFPRHSTESRIFQLLTHAIVPVPSYADLSQTTRCQRYSNRIHRIQSLQKAGTRPSHVVHFAFDGDELGDNRCVRANVPFPQGFHVAVFKRRDLGKNGESVYQIGFVASGYYEIQIVRRDREGDNPEQHLEEELTSVSLTPVNFPLVGRQPGWDRNTYGYHGDGGRFYYQATRGRLFGPRFGANDIVGCGVQRNISSTESHVYFTINGDVIAPVVEGSIESSYTSWYPAIGVDSYNEVRVNFGQEPFACDSIVNELLSECVSNVVTAADVPWYFIREYSIESLLWRRQQFRKSQSCDDFENWQDAISEKDKLPELGQRNMFEIRRRLQC